MNGGKVRYNGERFFDLILPPLERRLQVVRIEDNRWIASFVMLGDVELIEHCAALLAKRITPGFDVIAVPEAKGIPLAHTLARLLGGPLYGFEYCVIRKSRKAYFNNDISVPVRSITTAGKQRLYLDRGDIEKIEGRKVCFIDDVISTGGTVRACAELIRMAGGTVHQLATVLLEGDAAPGDFSDCVAHQLVHLGRIPVYVDGEVT